MLATEEAMFPALNKCLQPHSENIADSIGIACDGSAVMVGDNKCVVKS